MTDATAHISGDLPTTTIPLRSISVADVGDALRKGWDDFMAKPSHYCFVVLVYPLIGIALVIWAARGEALQLIYPLVSGFALVGPIAALGIYEISRRRERGLEAEWRHAADVLHSPALRSIVAVGAVLMAIFLIWLYAAHLIFTATFGDTRFETLGSLLTAVFTTGHGWTLLLMGHAVGALFAVLALSVSVVSLPLLLDRGGGAPLAIATSVRAVSSNPGPMLLWGCVVGALLLLGAVPGLAGLIVVLPVLGHATWHLYRKVVVDGGAAPNAGPL